MRHQLNTNVYFNWYLQIRTIGGIKISEVSCSSKLALATIQDIYHLLTKKHTSLASKYIWSLFYSIPERSDSKRGDAFSWFVRFMQGKASKMVF